MDQLPRLTFLGHSTVLIEIAGLRILTDPVLFDRIGPLRRVVTPLGLDLYARICAGSMPCAMSATWS